MAPIFPFIVVIIVIVAKAIAASQRNSGGTGTARRNFPPQNESEEERIRRFMEAVGRPTGTQQPPVMRPKAQAPARPLLPVNPPQNFPTVQPGRLKRVRTPEPGRPVMVPPVTMAPERTPIVERAQPAPALAADQPVYTRPLASTPVAQAITPAVATWASTPAASLLNKLREPASIRQAIILREVLGPPKALQGSYGGWSNLAAEAGPRRASS